MTSPQNPLIESHPAQEQIARNETRFKVAVTGRRWGKSVLGREVALKFAFEIKKSLVWIVCPTREMAKDIHWASLKERTKQLHWKTKTNESNLTITNLDNGSQISLKTADNPDRLRGRGIDLVVLDEFRDMEQNVWQEILRPALTDKKGSALFISTPHGHDVLYDLYLQGQKQDGEWKSWHYKTIDSPFIDEDEIEQARKDLDELTFSQEYEASFETGSQRPYYTYSYLNNAKYELDLSQPVIVTCDFNATVKPMSWVIGQRKIKGIQDLTYWVKAMSYQFTNTETMCIKLHEDYFMKLPSYPRQVIFYGDYSGKRLTSNSQFSDWQIIDDYFRNKTKLEFKRKYCKSVRDSISSTNSQLCNVLGVRRQFVDVDECKQLILDWEKIQWEDNGVKLKEDDDKRGHLCRAVDYYNDFEFSIKGKPYAYQ